MSIEKLYVNIFIISVIFIWLLYSRLHAIDMSDKAVADCTSKLAIKYGVANLQNSFQSFEYFLLKIKMTTIVF
jgi:hypothetical protein